MPFPTWDNPPLGLVFTSRYEPVANLGPAIQVASGVPLDWAQRSIETALLAQGHFQQNIAMTRGWGGSLSALDDVISMGKLVYAAPLTGDGSDPLQIATAVWGLVNQSDLLKAALEPVLAALEDTLSESLLGVLPVIEVLPIIGWAVSLVRFVVQGAQLLAEDYVIQVPYGPLWAPQIEGWTQGIIPFFDKANDEAVANRLLAILKTNDWTEVWTPSTKPWDALGLDYNGNNRIDGWHFGPEALFAKDLACMPGIAQFGSGFYGRNNFGADKVPVRSNVDLHPSANQIAGMAWQWLNNPTGQCCNIDIEKLRLAWTEWSSQGVQFLNTIPQEHTGDYQALHLMVRGALGFKKYGDFPGLDSNSILHTDLYPRSMQQKLVDYRINKALMGLREQILTNFRTTVAAAYVLPNAPALRNSMLKEVYLEERAKILEDSRVFDVELDLVPGKPYRNAVYRAQQKMSRPRVPPQRSPPPPQLPALPGQLVAGEKGVGSIALRIVLGVLAAGAVGYGGYRVYKAGWFGRLGAGWSRTGQGARRALKRARQALPNPATEDVDLDACALGTWKETPSAGGRWSELSADERRAAVSTLRETCGPGAPDPSTAARRLAAKRWDRPGQPKWVRAKDLR